MNKCYLKSTIMDFNYNIQTVRFLAVILVIISHAYPISGLGNDPLSILTKGDSNLGMLAVYTFLFLSGIYTARSYGGVKWQKQYIFLISRLKRLCPGLFVTILFTVFVVGSGITTLSLKKYLLNLETWKYFLNCMFIIQHKLPGVFESNAYAYSVNGSLWTLPLEVLCYCTIFILFKAAFLSEKSPVISILGVILGGQLLILYAVKNIAFIKGYQYHLHLCLIFFLGVVCYLYREKIYWNKYIQSALAILIGILVYLNVSHYTWIFIYLYFMLTVCLVDLGKVQS